MVGAPPSCPRSPQPQQRTAPSSRSTQEWEPPAARARTRSTAGVCGVLRGASGLSTAPVPSWALSLSPQQRTVWSASSAQECQRPSEIARAVVIPGTATGVGAQGLRVPSPSSQRAGPGLMGAPHCANLFDPQQRTPPSTSTAQA